MSELIFVTTENCELCNKAEKKIRFLKIFFSIKKVDVQSEYKEYLLRVPVLIKNEKVVVEGLFSRLSIVKNLFF
ncbi:MAG: glutaredoxin family protein [Candidatus Actinomarinaceae bacterium]